MPQRKDVFISYSHEDKSWLDRLCIHLRPLEKRYKIGVWSDARISPGGRWHNEIEAALASTRVAVLLVSADFLSSEFICNNELPPLLDAAEKEGTSILPLIVGPCGFLRHEGLRQFQPVNSAQPLIKLSKGDQEEIFERLADLIENLLAQAPQPVTVIPAVPGTVPRAQPVAVSPPSAASDAKAVNLWAALQKQLQKELDPEEFATWFGSLKVRYLEGNRLVLIAPNTRFLHVLEESYRPTVDRAVSQLTGPPVDILFSLGETESFSDSTPSFDEISLLDLGLFNPKFRFDTFVLGRSNEFAHAAASAVAGAPSTSYNPLFIYGGVGLGKTHLLHAIGHSIQGRYPHLRVLYLAAEQFVNELINSIRFDRMPAFRERYRAVDVLMIDDH
ncbi:MAG TPA: DnaA/Hda family protein [Thermoanaerobaculia bacterium]|nr:DnaA/Hda family protein [Thermoanaerobaculia bacterium]